MPREFNRNMFIMLVSVMIGIIIVTFFVADIMKNIEWEEKEQQHQTQMDTLESKNTNFTTRLLSSLSHLDKARELRASGNYHFDLAYVWYTSAINEDENQTFNTYKNSTIENCYLAIENYSIGYDNFGVAKNMFSNTLNFSDTFSNLVELYVNITNSAARLCLLRNNASMYIIYLAENLTFRDGGAEFMNNMSNITDLLNNTLIKYLNELKNYNELEDLIEKEYNIVGFSEIREEV